MNSLAAEQPATTPARVAEINKAPQDVFFSPTWEAAKAWGEPAVNFHNGIYTMIYDYFPTPLGFGQATSKDGVYWSDQGIIFERDEDVKDIECPDVHRYQPEGPWVMNYAFRNPSPFLTRIAVSDDLVHWKKLGPESSLIPDPRWYKANGGWCTFLPCPKGDGTYYGIWMAYGMQQDSTGFGFGTTTDGIHWNALPPVKLILPHIRQGLAGEPCGFFRIGDRYFITFSRLPLNRGREEFTLSSKRPEGPYELTPKNYYKPERFGGYARCYDLAGSIFCAEIASMVLNGRKRYHFPLLKKVEREGDSLWLKWWEGNEKLKVHPVALSTPARNKRTKETWRFDVPEALDLSKGTVIEGILRLPAKELLRRNFGLGAAVTANSTKKDLNQTPAGFEARNAVDGNQSTTWLADVSKGVAANLEIDLGEVRSIGHIRIEGKKIEGVEMSADGHAWAGCSNGVEAGDYVYLENLRANVRYVRLAVSKNVPDNINRSSFSAAGIADVRICQELCESGGRRDSGNVGIVLEQTGAFDFAILIAPDCTVKFGSIGKDGKGFHCLKERNVDVDFGADAAFRVVLRERLVEFYLNDYQISMANVNPTGRIGFFSFDEGCPVRDVKAWNSEPTQ